MQRDQVGIIPETGFHYAGYQSKMALKYIRWIEHTEGKRLQYYLRGGEFTIEINGRPARVDAYEKTTNTIYEIHGCVIHGCPEHTSPIQRHPFNDKPMSEVYKETCKRDEQIRAQGYNLKVIWEHDIDAMMDAKMLKFFKENAQIERMKIRNGFYGARTQTYRIFAEPDVAKGETIEHLDVVSMYPYILCNTPMPIGQPKVITQDFGPIRNYRGFMFVSIVPPKKLRYPILPLKLGNKLIFTLCNTCGKLKQNSKCTHTEEERTITGVYFHEELFTAMDNGYVIRHVYEVWHWSEEKWSTELFREFLKIFIREKAHASGWPDNVSTEEEKDAYIQEFYDNEGILMNKEEVGLNPAKRLIAKLAINSSWGKYAQRNDKSATIVLAKDSDQLASLIHNKTLDVEVENLSEDMYMALILSKEEYRQLSKHTNVAFAAITTTMGRLILWNALNRLGDRALYCDTDSVVMIAEPGKDNLEDLRGSYLGKWTSEVPHGHRIARFVSTGPKVYGYQLENAETGLLTEVVKVRGFTLDQRTSGKIDFNTLRSMAESLVRDNLIETVSAERSFIVKKKFGQVETLTMTKVLRAVMDKLRYEDDFTTLPFGWSK